MRQLLYGAVLIGLAGCGVPQAQHDQLNQQKQALETQVESLLEEKATLETRVNELEEQAAHLDAQAEALKKQIQALQQASAGQASSETLPGPTGSTRAPIIPPELLQGEAPTPPPTE